MTLPLRRVSDTEGGQPGDFVIDPPNEWNKGDIYFVCPNGRQCSVPIRNGEYKNTGVPRWGFNGNCDRPTLTPSINCDGNGGCGWHGHIINGEMVS